MDRFAAWHGAVTFTWPRGCPEVDEGGLHVGKPPRGSSSPAVQVAGCRSLRAPVPSPSGGTDGLFLGLRSLPKAAGSETWPSCRRALARRGGDIQLLLASAVPRGQAWPPSVPKEGQRGNARARRVPQCQGAVATGLVVGQEPCGLCEGLAAPRGAPDGGHSKAGGGSELGHSAVGFPCWWWDGAMSLLRTRGLYLLVQGVFG